MGDRGAFAGMGAARCGRASSLATLDGPLTERSWSRDGRAFPYPGALNRVSGDLQSVYVIPEERGERCRGGSGPRRTAAGRGEWDESPSTVALARSRSTNARDSRSHRTCCRSNTRNEVGRRAGECAVGTTRLSIDAARCTETPMWRSWPALDAVECLSGE